MNKYGPDLFKGTATYYSKYRPKYPSSLIRFLVQHFSLNGEQRVLDLGCGPGSVSFRLADWCHQIVGIDTDREMIAEAKYLHHLLRIGDIEWFHGDLDRYVKTHSKSFHLVTIAKAFHWMDRERTIETLYEMVEPGGGVAIIDNYESHKPLRPWQKKLNEVIKRWYGQERKAGNTTYDHPKKTHAQVLEDSKFETEVYYLPSYEIEWSIGTILGNLYSTSYGARRFLGDRVSDFEQDVRDALSQLNAQGIFKESMVLSVKSGRKM
ncbi:methyltransferase [Halobacillus andaensis]|uniref:Methyltransferase n=1 Tax=Halobacillus andaensis TaxID=1176239 RepID=A0A917B7U2_HALAA|nr:class I SAM-dependent methyltransferase [Halobacillus andaensis]MBP2006083.1 ubiquinone/menaquinone biosynthesis C-methylase UbiE [Halobacillus andaensis]GGF23755.1 methyltransferase [Halobacillus andaensis]